jgi:hypothetical protein
VESKWEGAEGTRGDRKRQAGTRRAKRKGGGRIKERRHTFMLFKQGTDRDDVFFLLVCGKDFF